MSFSQVIIIGHLGVDPDLKYTKNQTAILNLSVGVKGRISPDAPIDKKPKTHWHRCRAWGDRANQMSPTLKKGDKVFIKGNLVYDSWQDQKKNWHKDAIIEIEHLEKMYFENISIDIDSFK